MARVSYGSRASMSADYRDLTAMHKAGVRPPCATLDDLTSALKEDMDAAAASLVPECTTSSLSLSVSALIPLHRPNIGPYAEGGEHDLPPSFKTDWTDVDSDEDNGLAKKSFPQAAVERIVYLQDAQLQQTVQRAASRGIVAAIEAMDGFKYSFNNAWAAKDLDGQRFSYICQDSMQNKDRHANGFTRTQKHLKGEGDRGARKQTYDCKGSVSVKCSLARSCIDVHYRHYAIHPTLLERKSMPKQPMPRAVIGADTSGGVPASSHQAHSGGLFGRLQSEKSAFMPPPDTIDRQEVSNIGKPLKRKRESDTPTHSARDTSKPLSLAELLRQSMSTDVPTSAPSTTVHTATSMHPPPVTYDLPSWQVPPPVPISRQNAQASQHSAPYPPPYQPSQTPSRAPLPAASRPQPPPPPQEYFGPPKHHPQSQGLFATLKPVAQDPPIQGTLPFYSNRARTSCTNCRYSKKKCDETRPVCGSCARSGKYDCAYEGAWNYAPPPPQVWPGAENVAPAQPQTQPLRHESPDPWFPKR